MSSYIKLLTLEYPLHEANIRAEYSNISDDQTGINFPCPPEYALVHEVPIPILNDPLEYYYEGKPEMVDGIWRRTWIVAKRTEEEYKEFLEFMEKMKNPKIEKPLPNFKPEDLNKSGSAPDVIG